MRNQKKFVIGDIHGAYRAMLQCFDRADFNTEEDLLICLGDVCDGWPETNLAYDKLLEIKNLKYIMGNHDYWALKWMETGYSHDVWLSQGGWATVNGYKKKIPKSHIKLLSDALIYYQMDDKIFVHGGFDHRKKIENQELLYMIWDRSLVEEAIRKKEGCAEPNLSRFAEVYVGHTPTLNYDTTKPIKACEVWMMDTGAGWSGGVLSMMDIDSKEVFQSDRVDDLYPEFPGRGR